MNLKNTKWTHTPLSSTHSLIPYSKQSMILGKSVILFSHPSTRIYVFCSRSNNLQSLSSFLQTLAHPPLGIYGRGACRKQFGLHPGGICLALYLLRSPWFYARG